MSDSHETAKQLSKRAAEQGWGRSIGYQTSPFTTTSSWSMVDSGSLLRIAHSLEFLVECASRAWPIVEAARKSLAVEHQRRANALSMWVEHRLVELEKKHGPCPPSLRKKLQELNFNHNSTWLTGGVIGHDGYGGREERLTLYRKPGDLSDARFVSPWWAKGRRKTVFYKRYRAWIGQRKKPRRRPTVPPPA